MRLSRRGDRRTRQREARGHVARDRHARHQRHVRRRHAHPPDVALRADIEAVEAVIEELKKVDVESLTPIEALGRLRSGEQNLAVHPNCGTNFVTAGTFAGLAGAAAMLGVKRRAQDVLERLVLAAGLATVALIAAQPLGMLLQARVTTSAAADNLEIVSITRSQRGDTPVHRVLTRG